MADQFLLLSAAALGRRRDPGPAVASYARPRALAVGALCGVVAAAAGLPDARRDDHASRSARWRGSRFRHRAEGLWLMGFGLAPAAFACALASPSKAGEGRLAVRRRAEPARRARRVRPSERRRGPDRLGDDEPWRRRDDPVGAVEAVERPNGSVHACAARSRRGRPSPRRRDPWTARGRRSTSSSFGRRARLFPASADRPRPAPAPRVRRQARPAAVLRMVPRRLWVGERRFRARSCPASS